MVSILHFTSAQSTQLIVFWFCHFGLRSCAANANASSGVSSICARLSSRLLRATLCKTAVAIITFLAKFRRHLIPVDNIGNLLFQIPKVRSTTVRVRIRDSLNRFSASPTGLGNGHYRPFELETGIHDLYFLMQQKIVQYIHQSAQQVYIISLAQQTIKHKLLT